MVLNITESIQPYETDKQRASSFKAICLVLSLLAEATFHSVHLHNAIPRTCECYLDIFLCGDVSGEFTQSMQLEKEAF